MTDQHPAVLRVHESTPEAAHGHSSGEDFNLVDLQRTEGQNLRHNGNPQAAQVTGNDVLFVINMIV